MTPFTLLFLCQTKGCSKEAVYRGSCQCASAQDIEDLLVGLVAFYCDETDDESDDDGNTVHGGSNQKSGCKKDTNLAVAAD